MERSLNWNEIIALSYHAELLILDEPTSGLDPVSRDDLLDVFLGLLQAGITILFSTHITSNLNKCNDPDFIQYKLIALVVGVLFYALLTFAAYKKSVVSFEALDL